MKRIALGFALALALGVSAQAQTTPPPQTAAAAPDPQWDAHLATAKHFLEVSGARATFAAARDAAMNAMPAQLHAAYPMLDDAKISLYVQAIRDGYAQNSDAYFDHVAEIYARHLSEAELNDLIAFYQTDAGQKYVAEAPGLAKDMAVLQAQMMGQVMHDFIQKMQKGETTPK